jgi:hypothetical protein
MYKVVQHYSSDFNTLNQLPADYVLTLKPIFENNLINTWTDARYPKIHRVVASRERRMK